MHLSKQKVTLRIEEGEVELLKEKNNTDNQSEAIRLAIMENLATEDSEKVKTLFPYIGKKPPRIGRESELDAAKDFPDYDAQKSFINGEEVPYGTKGSVRPDYYKDGYSVDIKNYNVESASGRSNLARDIEKQYYQRIENLPKGTKQSVMIDIRGQNVTDADLSALYDDIMKRTDNGVEIMFKMN